MKTTMKEIHLTGIANAIENERTRKRNTKKIQKGIINSIENERKREWKKNEYRKNNKNGIERNKKKQWKFEGNIIVKKEKEMQRYKEIETYV